LGGCVTKNTARASAPPVVVDRSAQACVLSDDGFIWYRVPAGTFPPIYVRYARCGLDKLGQDPRPPLPRWSIPTGPTQTRFIATSLQQTVSLAGMQSLERLASSHHIPMTWMIGNMGYIPFASTYNAYHADNGDDVQSAYFPSLHKLIASHMPWYDPRVSIMSAGTERLIPQGLYPGEHAFWGIAWNSNGTDGTRDIGAPWGAYCADVTSYKRPQPNGGCDLLAFEWTARDLTRAYFGGREDIYSTDPDDVLHRGGFSVSAAMRYERQMVDAYAAAGQSKPNVMIVQQESHDEIFPGSAQIMDAIFSEARRDGMKAETLGEAASDARTFSAAPQAIAFPFIPGGPPMLAPATIHYHDTKAGMTFLGGQTMPSRIFRYADYPQSRFNRAIPHVPQAQMPALIGAHASGGWLTLSIYAPVAIRSGAAIWADPARTKLTGAGTMPVSRAASIIIFELKRGNNVVRYRCPQCNGTTFTYSR